MSSLTFLVIFALSEPLTEHVSVFDFNEWDLVLLGKGGNELLVLGVVTVSGEDAKMSVLSVEGFTDLVESLDQSYITINFIRLDQNTISFR